MHSGIVLEAIEGNEALRAAEQHDGPIHLLLTDVVMPGIGGRELAQRLSQQRPEMRVLYMSGYTGDTTLFQGIIEHEVDFIQKPFTLDALSHKIRQVLDAADKKAN